MQGSRQVGLEQAGEQAGQSGAGKGKVEQVGAEQAVGSGSCRGGGGVLKSKQGGVQQAREQAGQSGAGWEQGTRPGCV